jgi:ubiquinone/menaquinone biosynthesis C-methylase UbiE
MLEACADLEVTRQDDPLRLPYGDATIDWLTAVCVFHHVEPGDRPALIDEMSRVLKPGGIIAVIEHNPFNPAVQIIVRRTPVDANARLLSARHTRTLLRTGGVNVVDTRYFLLLPEAVHRRLGAVESALAHVPLGGQYAVFGRTAA